MRGQEGAGRGEGPLGEEGEQGKLGTGRALSQTGRGLSVRRREAAQEAEPGNP